MKRYEILIDLYNCKTELSEKNIRKYIIQICRLIKMERHGKTIIWEDYHNKIKKLRGGVSAFQFLKTSNIILHSFKDKSCYIDIFSCKKFDFNKVIEFSKKFFQANKLKTNKIKS